MLGAAVSLTGKYALNGANTKNGYELAVHKINDSGGVSIGGRPYKLVVRYYDDESTPARGTELAERLVKQDGVKFMLGPYSSGLTKAILPVIEKYKVPMVEGNGAARELFTKGYRYVFAVLSTSDQYLTPAIELAAEHAEKLGKTKDKLKVALAMENDPFAQDVRAGVLDDVQRHGMMVVIDDQLPPELNDMSVTLTKVKALEARRAGDLRPREGRAHRDRPDQGAASLCADPRHDALRLGADRREDGQGGRACVLRPSMAPLARLQGRCVRHGGGFRQSLRGGLRL